MTPRTWIVVACAFVAAFVASEARATGSTLLSPTQQATILAEAEAAYARGTELAASDRAAANEAFSLAAAKYRLLADGAAHNDRLYFNLANAQLQSGDAAGAIANYLRAEALAPSNPRIAVHLEHARQLVGTSDPSLPQGLWFSALRLIAAYRKLLLAGAVLTWAAFWGAMIAERFSPHFRWQLVALPAASLALVCGAPLLLDHHYQDSATHGVVTGHETIVRAAGGTAFAPSVEQPLVRGTEFDVVSRGADWLEIRLSDGRSGWIPSTEAEVIERRAM